MNVAITGASGFIGSNLQIRFKENNINYETISHQDTDDVIKKKIKDTDFLFHLAGVNRPKNELEFQTGNTEFTKKIADIIENLRLNIPIVFTSSIQAETDNAYGKSKYMAEKHLEDLQLKINNNLTIIRLPNIFGKWCKPNYNSVIATFCYNTARDIKNKIDDPEKILTIVYIDDLMDELMKILKSKRVEDIVNYYDITNKYNCSVNDLNNYIIQFKESRKNLITQNVGNGLLRALYATYLSYLPKDSFSYELFKNEDQRGIFVEILKTKKSGQFSYFTAHPGVTRGAHYHHTKTEKFLVVKGKARFNFKHMSSNEVFEICIEDKDIKIVESIPGWFHEITNIGKDKMIVFLWGSEIFDNNLPDTFAK